MRIVIQDTNIFIDLFNGGILSLIDTLPYKFIITDLVYHEMHKPEELIHEIDSLVEEGVIIIKEFSPDELEDMFDYGDGIENRGNLSTEDISVLYVAKKENLTLITNDGKLRSVAKKEEIDLKGLFFILDELKEKMSHDDFCDALRKIDLANPRLPKREIESRLR